MRRPSLALFGSMFLGSAAAADLEITCSLPGTFIDVSTTETALGLGDDVQWSFNTPGAVGAGDVLTLRQVGDAGGDGVMGVNDFLLLLAFWS